MADIYIPDSEELGRRRFPDNKSFRLDLYNRATILIGALLDLFASNYPQDTSTHTSHLLRVLAREFARLRWDMDALSNDKEYTATRIAYLQQILGERLFLQDRIAPANYNDETFRDYLIYLKNAYFKGSTKSNIEATATKFTGIPIRIKELYLEARKPHSGYDISDTHKMVVELLVDDFLSSGIDLGLLVTELKFFIDLIRPAHVLYDTNLIWTEQIDVNKIHDLIYGDTGGGCVPVYDYLDWSETVYYAYQVTIVANPGDATGRIDSIHQPDYTFFLTDQTRVICDPGVNGTKIFNLNGKRISFNDLRIGDYVRLTYVTIPGDWQFWWVPGIPGLSGPARFYPSVYRLPAVQENVKKVMDSQGRFPLQIKTTPTTICDRWVQDLLNPLYEDLRHTCYGIGESDQTSSVVLSERMGYPRLHLPYDSSEVFDTSLYGDNYAFTMPHIPLTDGSGSPATIADVSAFKDSTSLPGSLISVDASSGLIKLTNSYEYWDTTGGGIPIPGNEFNFDYYYLSDGTDTTASSSFGFGFSYWQMPSVPLLKGDSSGTLASPEDIKVSVDGTSISDSVIAVRPLFGHVILNSSTDFWVGSELGRLPQVGDTFDFYYYRGYGQVYALLFDDIERMLDSWSGAGSPYGMVLDGAYDASASSSTPVVPLEIGYRYRAYLLHHSSVLNSPDTLRFNDYQKPAKRASIVNQQDALNHKNLFFSGEFLYDTSAIIELNDLYLENGLDPVLKLWEGTPPFQKTFSHHPDLVYHRKVQDIRQHHNPLIYSDLLLRDFITAGESIPLSSICDSDNFTIKIRYTETIPPIEECDPWILMDSVETEEVEVTIPGGVRAVPNVRVADKNLRDNIILRETEDAGVISVTYSIQTPEESVQNIFYMPETIRYYTEEYGYVDFPSLPIMKDETTQAGIYDVEVKIDDVVFPNIISSIDPVTGRIELNVPNTYVIVEHHTITAGEVAAGILYLSQEPIDPEEVLLNVIHGPPQYYGTDFYVSDQKLFWKYGPLDGMLQEGDVVRITYETQVLVDALVEFTYKILNTRTCTIIDINRTRILDYIYVFPSACPDPIVIEAGLVLRENVNFLDDYSDGIKMVFFNKDTQQIEKHIFSGPVFEMYDASLDQIGPPETFPNALVRIEGMCSGNPLKITEDYGFLNDELVRFRKKTFKELLPDRTFRTLELTEMMSV